jgi:hypothetical protein
MVVFKDTVRVPFTGGIPGAVTGRGFPVATGLEGVFPSRCFATPEVGSITPRLDK